MYISQCQGNIIRRRWKRKQKKGKGKKKGQENDDFQLKNTSSR